MASIELQGENMEEIISEATAKGLVLVDSEATEKLFADCERITAEANALCEVVDPESRPFDSKYKARELLDGLVRQLQASRAIATLENKSTVKALLDEKIACTQLRIGSISWDCEEPHNAQRELEEACTFFFPSLVQEIERCVQDKETLQDNDEVVDPEKQKEIDKARAALDFETLSLPAVRALPVALLGEGLKLLNLLGILWAGRGQPYRSLHYLLLAKQCFIEFQKENETESLESDLVVEIESAHTHTLFYLAQAYGNLGNAKQSSRYCHETLQRQLSANLTDLGSAVEWVRNCSGVADYFFALDRYQGCALALASADRVLRERVISVLHREMEREKALAGVEGEPSSEPTQKPNFVSGHLNAAETEAELHRRWALLHTHLLKRAAERERERQTAREMGMSEEQIASYQDVSESEREDQALLAYITDNNNTSEQRNNVESSPLFCFFTSLPVSLPTDLSLSRITDYATARAVFLRGATHIEAAKKYFVLDGYVTDHCGLLQQYSSLYHSLAVFESDVKRKLAMELRRMEILTPCVRTLNRTAYEVLHKQISYELGETAQAVLDLKLDKCRSKQHNSLSQDIDTSLLKKSEIAKAIEYTRFGYAMFSHFSFLYAHNDDRTQDNSFVGLENLPFAELMEKYCKNPDESSITADEVRPFLNATFLSCRLLSKVLPSPQETPKQHAQYLVCALRRYQWLCDFAPRLCEKKGLSVDEVFGEELKIVREMVRLLPSKIDRMCFLGEKGLSI